MHVCFATLRLFLNQTVRGRSQTIICVVIATYLTPLMLVLLGERPNVVAAADDPKKPGVLRVSKDKDADSDGALPKYAEMELPSVQELMSSKPFDWIVLKTLDVVIVYPVGPRPDTLNRLNTEHERYLRGRAGMIEGEEKLKDRRRQFQRIQVTLVDPGEDQDPDYTIETKMISKIDYFEDLVLRRANLLIDEGKIAIAYDLLMFVDRRNRENNATLTEAHEARKQEEAAAKAEEERYRFSVPDQLPLKLPKTWPKFDEAYHRLLLKDAEQRSGRGDDEGALRILENLWDHNSMYPGLSEAVGQVIDQLANRLIEGSDFRQLRYFLGRLSARDSQHPTYLKWKADLISRTQSLLEAARASSAEGNGPSATNQVELAARIWPDTPGLKEAHRELIDRFQSVRLGVLRLPGEPTTYPLIPPAEVDIDALTSQSLFEPIRVDERGVRYRSALFESWEPADLGRQVQFTLRLKRADWEARPMITSADVLSELAGKLDPNQSTYDERLAGAIEQVSVQSPSQFTIHFRRLPLRLEALLQIPVSLNEESLALNPDLPADAQITMGRQRFFEATRDARQVAYRRVRPQPSTTKVRNIDEIVEVRYDSWDRQLQGLLRGEIVGIPYVNHRDLKMLQDDNRFFVLPYTLPNSHFILFNPRTPALHDGQLRRALTFALPREELIKTAILPETAEAYARPIASPFPTVSYAHNRLLTEPPFDPQRAAALALTAKKQMGGELPVLKLACPPDPNIRAAAVIMIESWRRVGITVQLVEGLDAGSRDWDLAYRTTRIIEPLTQVWPLLSLQAEAKVESLRPMPDRVRRQLLELERVNDWTSATKLLHRIESELLVEARYIPLWEVDEFFVTRRNLTGLPTKLMHPFQDVERWMLQSWYPQDNP